MRAGEFIFVSGQLPFDDEMNIVKGGIEVQTRAALDQVARSLQQVDASLDHVVKVMVWLTDADDFPVFNRTYAEFFPENPPARATVCSALMLADARVEVEAIAYAPG